jgi:hypothetical protein
MYFHRSVGARLRSAECEREDNDVRRRTPFARFVGAARAKKWEEGSSLHGRGSGEFRKVEDGGSDV